VSGDAIDGRGPWANHSDRLIDENPHIRVNLTDVELPDGTEFTQHVFRLRRCAMIAVLDEPGTKILLLRRHRFIIDRWVWSFPAVT
jgi:hypothetical protein